MMNICNNIHFKHVTAYATNIKTRLPMHAVHAIFEHSVAAPWIDVGTNI